MVSSMTFYPTMIARPVLLVLSALVGTCGVLWAQEEASIQVSEVRFNPRRDEAGQTWWGAEVDLTVQADGGGRGRFSDRLGVTLQWGVESPQTEGGFLFLRATAISATVEAGRVVYRFYLPPAVAQRERIESPPRFWAVRVVHGKTVLPDTRASVGPGLSGPEALANFRRQVAARAPAQDGVLLPWYHSPFANVGGGDAPVPLRFEAVPAGH